MVNLPESLQVHKFPLQIYLGSVGPEGACNWERCILCRFMYPMYVCHWNEARPLIFNSLIIGPENDQVTQLLKKWCPKLYKQKVNTKHAPLEKPEGIEATGADYVYCHSPLTCVRSWQEQEINIVWLRIMSSRRRYTSVRSAGKGDFTVFLHSGN